jgi:hypothetical protein
LNKAFAALGDAHEREGILLRRAVGALADLERTAATARQILNAFAGRPEDE